MHFLVILFLVIISNTKELKLILKNEDEVELRGINVEFFSLRNTVLLEKENIFIDRIRKDEKVEIAVPYKVIKSDSDKVIISVKDKKGEIIVCKIIKLNYKKEKLGGLKESKEDFKFFFSFSHLNIFFKKEGLFEIDIYDISGRKVFSRKEIMKKGKYTYYFPFLPDGEYFYILKFNGIKKEGKFIKMEGS
ncbi:MAG: hypothetical protein ABIN23_03055 [candidate division WOR-3 bacterium]|nr:gliding motility-associated C-terminal domain-containing protein [Candidatus Omnitrophota bacterium]